MKRYLYCLILICALSKQDLVAQKTYNKWFFGYHGGLDFNTDPPTPLSNTLIEGLQPPNYIASVCDANGDLLFYTNGFSVWNRFDEQLPKLQGRWPWFGVDNVLPLICPYPGNDTLFYIFSVGSGNSPNAGRLVSLTINTAANYNTAGIVYPQPSTNTNYFSVHTENAVHMLAGTAHCNQEDSWIVTVANGAMHAWLVTPSGISAQPVVSPLPSTITQSSINSGYSNIRFSANGERAVVPVISMGKLLVYDFNNQTGIFSNPKIIGVPDPEVLLDAELSPAGKRLYYGSYVDQMEGPDYTGVELHYVFQLDLEAGDVTAVEASRFNMNSFPDRGGCPRRCFILKRTLQAAPDGRIYISMRDVDEVAIDRHINVIEFPDRLREAASYRRNFVTLKEKYKFINVNYIRSGSFSLEENGILVRKKTCFGLPAEFSLLFTRIDSVKWDFGDPASGTANYSTDIAPSHVYPAVGVYTVKAVIFKNCWTDTAITQISMDPDPIVRLPSFIKDTIVCVGNKLHIDAFVPAATSYQWSDGLIYSYRDIDKAGQFQVQAYNDCSHDQRSFTVSFENCPCDVFVPTAFTPNNDGLNDVFKPMTQCFAKDVRFQVFDRFGTVVFSTSDMGQGWDGRYKKMPLNSGVFVWLLQYRDPNNNAVKIKRGTVTLIR